MIRASLVILLVAVVAVAAIALQGDSGHAEA